MDCLLTMIFPLLLISFCQIHAFVLNDVQPTNCGSSEHFSSHILACVVCSVGRGLVPSADKSTCECSNSSIIAGTDNDGYPICQKCPATKIPSLDRTFCVQPSNTTQYECQSKRGILVDRDQNGTNLTHQSCVKCSKQSRPSDDLKRCIPCHFTMKNCNCSSRTHELIDNACYPKNDLVNSIDLDGEKEHSAFKLFKSAVLRCRMKHLQSCQEVKNYCVLYYNHLQKSPLCKIETILDLKNKKFKFPGIFYNGREVTSILYNKNLTVKYGFGQTNHIKIIGIEWSKNGVYVGRKDFIKALSFCTSLSNNLPTIKFATKIHSTCMMSPDSILKHSFDGFYEFYLQYQDKNQTLLYNIPILNLSLKDKKKYVNKDRDMSNWILTRRMFVVDSYDEATNSKNSLPHRIRYLKSVHLRFKVQEGTHDGSIYPPLLEIEYGELNKDDFELNTPLQVSFDVDYSMTSNTKAVFDACLSITCVMAAGIAFLRSWQYAQRSGQNTFDILTALSIFIEAIGPLANAFYIVTSLASIYSFVYFKGQTTVYTLLPDSKLLYYVRTYVIVSFSLKLIEYMVMIWRQISIDVFLIDWEEPHRKDHSRNESVSAWRTYFVANEWNQMQTVRKTSTIFQFGVTVILLKVYGLEHWALSDPELHVHKIEGDYIPYNMVFRFAITVLVYTGIYTIQWIFMVCIYERYYRNPVREFVDICPLANISIFILAQARYGYYIHGRSVHGFSDTDMATLRDQLHREEEDLVGHRGLLLNSDHQTFEVLIPNMLLECYYSLLYPGDNKSMLRLRSIGEQFKKGNPIKDKKSFLNMEIYIKINRLLTAFIEHALKDIDYDVKEKTCMESLLGVGLVHPAQRGIFYVDNGSSFENAIYYGNELTCFTFDLFTFSFFQVFINDIIVSVIVTVLIQQITNIIRRSGGRKNLAKKSLIDEHFLI